MWQKGQSGNPLGGRMKKSARLRAEASEEMLPYLLDRLFALAMEGNVAAIKLLVDRFMPVPKSTADLIDVELPAGPEGSSTEKAKALLAAAVAGELPPDVAAELIAALGRIVQVEQGDELRKRVEQLEDLA